MKNKRLVLTLSDGGHVVCDQAIATVGVEANTELAKTSDLEVDPEVGGFLVNTELQARTDLYAVSYTYFLKLGLHFYNCIFIPPFNIQILRKYVDNL